MCTGLEFVLALLAVFVPVGFPSTLPCCHVAVKPTICDMLLNHENLGTDTLLPTPLSESREYLLGSLMHTIFVFCLCCVPSTHSVSTREFEENSCGLPLNTDFLGHSLSHSHVLFLPRLVFPTSFENVLNFRCLLGAHICPMSDACYFLTFPHLLPFHYSTIFENILCIHW